MLIIWNAQKKHIDRIFSIVALSLCVMKEVREDVVVRMNGSHHKVIERVIMKMILETLTL
jgi:hypothetical protein